MRLSKQEKMLLAELRGNLERAILSHLKEFETSGVSRIEAIQNLELSLHQFFLNERAGGVSKLPAFDTHGYLPAMHQCSLEEFQHVFGRSSTQRSSIMNHLRSVFDLCQQVEAERIMIGGSYITAKPAPRDVDVTILVESNFFQISKHDDTSPHAQ